MLNPEAGEVAAGFMAVGPIGIAADGAPAGEVAPAGVIGAVPGMVGVAPEVGDIGVLGDMGEPAGLMPFGPDMGPDVAAGTADAAEVAPDAAIPVGDNPACDAPARPFPPLRPDCTDFATLTLNSGCVRFGMVGTAACSSDMYGPVRNAAMAERSKASRAAGSVMTAASASMAPNCAMAMPRTAGSTPKCPAMIPALADTCVTRLDRLTRYFTAALIAAPELSASRRWAAVTRSVERSVMRPA